MLFVVMLLLITLLSLLPIDHPSAAPHDKLNHLLGWATLGLLAGLAWPARRMLWPVLWGYSWFIEVLQGLTGYRQFSVADGFANLAGLVLGVVLLTLWYKIRSRTQLSTGAGRPE